MPALALTICLTGCLGPPVALASTALPAIDGPAPTRAADSPAARSAAGVPAGPATELPSDPAAGVPSDPGSDPTAEDPSRTGRWAWPLTPRPEIARAYDPPLDAWGAGHRGLDLSASAGQEVHAVESGTISHVGRIAGRGTVSVLHADGLRSTYEPLEPTVRHGQRVPVGTLLGRLAAAGSHCAPTPCLHLGARRGEAYTDPEPLLRRPRIILLPLDSRQ